MKTKKGLFISHEEAIHICDKNQYGEASFFELIKLNLRMIHCRMTRAYSKKNTILTKFIKKTSDSRLSSSEKEDMKKMFSDNLSK